LLRAPCDGNQTVERSCIYHPLLAGRGCCV
jgi:hypothetical protein